MYENGQCLGVPGYPENFVGPKKPLKKFWAKSLTFLSLKLGTCLYGNRQCLGVPVYNENFVGVLNLLGGDLRVPKKI